MRYSKINENKAIQFQYYYSRYTTIKKCTGYEVLKNNTN